MKQKRRQSQRWDSDQLPPYAAEMEAGLLGACLLGGYEALNLCEEAGVSEAWFYDQRHRMIWGALNDAHLAGSGADVNSVWAWIKQSALQEQFGPEGFVYLTGLPEQCPSAGNLTYYLEPLRELAQLRGILRVCTAYAQAAQERQKPGELLAQLEKRVTELAECGKVQRETSLRELVLRVMADLDEYHRGSAQIKGLTTGLDYVDKLLCGLGGENGNYIVLSGRPGTGKTSLAMQIALHLARDYVWFEPVLDEHGKPVPEMREGKEVFKVARKQGVPVGVFSMEMKDRSLVQRMVFQRAGADLQRWRTGFAENASLPMLCNAASQMVSIPNFWVDDEPRMTIERLRSKARRWKRQYGIKFFVVDYIQLLRSAQQRFRQDRVQELSEISAELQALGKELDTPFLVLAQMNRDYEKEPTRTPRLSDLKDCGSIEQDADLVGFLYPPKMKAEDQENFKAVCNRAFGEEDWSKKVARVNLYFAKNRYGPCGACELFFQKSCTCFYDWVRFQKDAGTKEFAMGDRKPHAEPEPAAAEPVAEPEPEQQEL